MGRNRSDNEDHVVAMGGDKPTRKVNGVPGPYIPCARSIHFTMRVCDIARGGGARYLSFLNYKPLL